MTCVTVDQALALEDEDRHRRIVAVLTDPRIEALVLEGTAVDDVELLRNARCLLTAELLVQGVRSTIAGIEGS